jgi:hypothetical protein
MRIAPWVLAAAIPLLAAAAPHRHAAPAPAVAGDSVIVRVTSMAGPVTFDGRYLVTGDGMQLMRVAPHGVIAPRATPYTLALPVREFHGMFRQVGGSGRMQVALALVRGGKVTATATSGSALALVIATEQGTVATAGF